MKISHKIIFTLVFIILFSFFLTSLIANKMISSKFNLYLIKDKEDRIESIAKEINQTFKNNNYSLYKRDINTYSRLENVYIGLENNYSYNKHGKSFNSDYHSHKMGPSHNNNLKDNPNYREKSFPLYKDGLVVDNIIIGYIDESYLTENAMLFMETLKESFKISGTITLILGIFISIFLSKSLIKPLLKIRETALEIKNGNLLSKTNLRTNTLELKDLALTIEVLGESLYIQEGIRNQYASDISHELRTPITTIKAYLEALLDGVWKPSKDNLKTMVSEVNRLAKMVEDLEKSFKSDNFDITLRLETFDISSEIINLLTSFKPMANKKNITLSKSIEENILVTMDKDKIKQVISNLISNSLYYTDPGGEISIYLKDLGEKVLITVKDNGIGIREKDLDFIFNRFYRADSSRNRHTGGSGLGLAIVKNFVKKHKGTIEVKSQYKKGSSFEITLEKNPTN